MKTKIKFRCGIYSSEFHCICFKKLLINSVTMCSIYHKCVGQHFHSLINKGQRYCCPCLRRHYYDTLDMCLRWYQVVLIPMPILTTLELVPCELVALRTSDLWNTWNCRAIGGRITVCQWSPEKINTCRHRI
jgi:hypothetical protein